MDKQSGQHHVDFEPTGYENASNKKWVWQHPGRKTARHSRLLRLPVKWIRTLPGLRGEDEILTPEMPKIKALSKLVPDKKWQREHPIEIEIQHDGEAYITDGNHRALACEVANVPSYLCRVLYYGGGEEHFDINEVKNHEEDTLKVEARWGTPGPVKVCSGKGCGKRPGVGMFCDNCSKISKDPGFETKTPQEYEPYRARKGNLDTTHLQRALQKLAASGIHVVADAYEDYLSGKPNAKSPFTTSFEDPTHDELVEQNPYGGAYSGQWNGRYDTGPQNEGQSSQFFDWLTKMRSHTQNNWGSNLPGNHERMESSPGTPMHGVSAPDGITETHVLNPLQPSINQQISQRYPDSLREKISKNPKVLQRIQKDEAPKPRLDTYDIAPPGVTTPKYNPLIRENSSMNINNLIRAAQNLTAQGIDCSAVLVSLAIDDPEVLEDIMRHVKRDTATSPDVQTFVNTKTVKPPKMNLTQIPKPIVTDIPKIAIEQALKRLIAAGLVITANDWSVDEEIDPNDLDKPSPKAEEAYEFNKSQQQQMMQNLPPKKKRKFAPEPKIARLLRLGETPDEKSRAIVEQHLPRWYKDDDGAMAAFDYLEDNNKHFDMLAGMPGLEVTKDSVRNPMWKQKINPVRYEHQEVNDVYGNPTTTTTSVPDGPAYNRFLPQIPNNKKTKISLNSLRQFAIGDEGVPGSSDAYGDPGDDYAAEREEGEEYPQTSSEDSNTIPSYKRAEQSGAWANTCSRPSCKTKPFAGFKKCRPHLQDDKEYSAWRRKDSCSYCKTTPHRDSCRTQKKKNMTPVNPTPEQQPVQEFQKAASKELSVPQSLSKKDVQRAAQRLAARGIDVFAAGFGDLNSLDSMEMEYQQSPTFKHLSPHHSTDKRPFKYPGPIRRDQNTERTIVNPTAPFLNQVMMDRYKGVDDPDLVGERFIPLQFGEEAAPWMGNELLSPEKNKLISRNHLEEAVRRLTAEGIDCSTILQEALGLPPGSEVVDIRKNEEPYSFFEYMTPHHRKLTVEPSTARHPEHPAHDVLKSAPPPNLLQNILQHLQQYKNMAVNQVITPGFDNKDFDTGSDGSLQPIAHAAAELAKEWNDSGIKQDKDGNYLDDNGNIIPLLDAQEAHKSKKRKAFRQFIEARAGIVYPNAELSDAHLDILWSLASSNKPCKQCGMPTDVCQCRDGTNMTPVTQDGKPRINNPVRTRQTQNKSPLGNLGNANKGLGSL